MLLETEAYPLPSAYRRLPASHSRRQHKMASWDFVVAAAKKEGKVVVYSMALGAPYLAAVVKSFEKEYGIAVESLDLRASELVERIRTEQPPAASWATRK